MNAICKYLFLPKEISPTEKAHVERINRIVFIAFFCHIPIFVGVAYLADTGPLLALFLSVLTLVGPALAYYTLENHRTIAQVFGFTSMCLGGLLVHFGQGPMQIEMHFYFFVLLALLAMYGNPAVNLTAALTAAVHHFSIWLLLPSSVFNYDASIVVVGVHALFVVIETAAAIFIARSFYDNVIGLEKIVTARTQELSQRNHDMRLVLDHVNQGLLTVTLNGEMSDERSKIIDTWMGPPPASKNLFEWLHTSDPKAAEWMNLGFEELRDDILPTEILLEQLPNRLTIGPPGAPPEKQQQFVINYQPILDDDQKIERLLVVVTDITRELRQAEKEALQRENLRLFELIASDASGFGDFYEEAERLITRLREDTDIELPQLKRLIHTLKGNTALFGLDRISRVCHEIEDIIDSSGEYPNAQEMARISEAWLEIDDKVEKLSGGDRENQVVVQRSDLKELTDAIHAKHSHGLLEEYVNRIALEPCAKRLSIVAEQARKIADRLGRDNIDIKHQVIEDLRIDTHRWSSFWSSIVHVLRNAIDHGLEPVHERTRVGKSDTGRIALRSYTKDSKFIFEIEDDGRGIDTQSVAAKARAKGLKVQDKKDILMAIFEDGLSTKDHISEISGRGVGMSAVRQETHALGGRIQIQSVEGKGTRFSFVFPIEQASIPPEIQS